MLRPPSHLPPKAHRKIHRGCEQCSALETARELLFGWGMVGGMKATHDNNDERNDNRFDNILVLFVLGVGVILIASFLSSQPAGDHPLQQASGTEAAPYPAGGTHVDGVQSSAVPGQHADTGRQGGIKRRPNELVTW